MTSAPAIIIDGVSYAQGGLTILDDVSMSIGAGEYLGLIGPNGGGKTTLMKIMLGLLEPTSGSVSIFGQAPRIARKGGSIGYVPQRIVQAESIFPATVDEVVRSGLAASPNHLHAESCVTDAMKLTDVSDLKDRLVSKLSGGQRQRVFIARALASHPKVLLLDEPTTGVDAASEQAFYAILKKLNEELGLTIIFVSHDIEVLARQATTVAVLNQRLLMHGAAEEVHASLHSHFHAHHA